MDDDEGSLEGREGAWKLMSGFSKCFFGLLMKTT
jgi:hypothetical protein